MNSYQNSHRSHVIYQLDVYLEELDLAEDLVVHVNGEIGLHLTRQRQQKVVLV